MAFEPLFDASQAGPFKFEKHGDFLEAFYVGSFDFEGDYGPTKKHLFKKATGEALVIFGQRNLMQQLPTATVGAMTRITYNDDLPPTKRGLHPMKKFAIEQDRSRMTTVTAVDTSYVTPSDSIEDVSDADIDPVLEALDEAVAPRAVAPEQAAALPNAARAAKVQELLNRNRAPKTA